MRVREAFGIYFTRIKSKEFNEIFLTDIFRILKRNPSETIQTIIIIFDNIRNLGSGDVHKEFGPLLISELKARQSARRDMALNTFKLYTKYLRNITDLLKKGSSAGSSKADERLEFIHCFEYLHSNCMNALSDDGYKEFSNKLMDSLITILNKESNEQIREAILNIINTIITNFKKNEY